MGSQARTLSMTALSGLLAGLSGCASAPPVTEVTVAPDNPTSAGADTNTGSPETATDSEPQQVAEDPGAPDETVARAKPKKRPKRAEPVPAGNTNVASPKNCCAGLNACKGLGGCKTAQNACMGKNMCKGQGGCKTGDCSP